MAKTSKFVIGSLIAAGLAPFSSSADTSGTEPDNKKSETWLDSVKQILKSIDNEHEFTVAGHQSHSSHYSHSSHRSYNRPPDIEPGDATAFLSTGDRNTQSTPPTSILPSSPALTKKVKVLPGNSGKFQELVSRVQLALTAKGLHSGEITGEVDAVTVAAVYKYQDSAGLVPSGKITNETLSSLGIVAQ